MAATHILGTKPDGSVGEAALDAAGNLLVGFAAGAGPVEPLTTVDVVDDFFGGAATTGQLGTHGWSFAGGSAASLAGVAGHPGLVRRDTSATAATIAYTRLQISTAFSVLLASESFDATWVFRLGQSDADTKLRLGFSNDWTGDAPASAVYLEKQYADTSFFGTVRIASVETRTAALAASDANWHRVRIRRLDPATVAFSVDGGAEVPIACSLGAGVNPGAQLTNQAAVAKTMDLDFFRLRIAGLAR